MENTILKKYRGPVPRYTSYPTAVQFHPGAGTKAHAAWLGALPRKRPVSLYLHVPYCHQLCWYCACHTHITARYAPLRRYLDALEKEIALVSSYLGFTPGACHVHFGGGSPNLIGPEDFVRLMRVVDEHFAIGEDAEIAIEADPRLLSREKIGAFTKAGVNRVSLGVQDFTPRVQRAINRVQPFSMVREAVLALRSAGIRGINFDLMYGLPGQRLADVIRNVDLAVGLVPERLAVFGYAHVPWLKPHQKMIPEAALPDVYARFDMAEAIAERLASFGYIRAGLDHFARPGDALALAAGEGRLRRNFQGYTTDQAETLIGFGASAISKFPAGFLQNAPSIGDYERAAAAGGFATVRGVETTAEDRLRWEVIESLMCRLEADLGVIAGTHKVSGEYFAPEIEVLKELEPDGLVRLDGLRITIPEAARAFVRVVCAAFDQYLQPEARHHSQAV